MNIATLVVLMFIAVTAAVIGASMLLAGRSQAKSARTIERRLGELSNVSAQAALDEAGPLVIEQKAGPLPQVERVASQALKGSTFEQWVQQSGTTMGIGMCVI